MQAVRIGNYWVGQGTCFIIAEIGSNHDVNLNQAKQLIDKAVEAGANAVKFQSFTAEKLTVTTDEDFKLLKSIEFPIDWYEDIAQYCFSKNVIFMSTPFDLEAVELLERVNVPIYKIASGDITYFPLLKKVAKIGKPIILSTGKSNIQDVEKAVEYLKEFGCQSIVLLHCIAAYPTPESEANLNAIAALKNKFKFPVGFSDHTLSIIIPSFAVCFGADVIEKHFTLNKKLPGPDHSFALNPKEFAEMVQLIRLVEKVKGNGEKVLSPTEQKRALTGRRGIFAAKNIARGTILTEAMVACLRPQLKEANIPASLFEKVVGSRLLKDINKDTPFTFEHVTIERF